MGTRKDIIRCLAILATVTSLSCGSSLHERELKRNEEMTRKDRYDDIEKKGFRSLNLNPAGRHTGDCVYRSLAAFLDWSWLDVFWDLTAHCAQTGLVQTYKSGYGSYLSRLGFEAHEGPRHPDGKRYTIGEFRDKVAKPGMKYVCTSSNHMTYIEDKVITDTWDCSGRVCDTWWERPMDGSTIEPLYPDIETIINISKYR